MNIPNEETTVHRSTAMLERVRNLGKSASPLKYLSLVDGNLKLTLNALATEIKKAVANKNKESLEDKFKS